MTSTPRWQRAEEMVSTILRPLLNNNNLKNWLPLFESTGEPFTPWIQAHGEVNSDLSLEEVRALHQRRERPCSELNGIVWRMGDEVEIDALICLVALHSTPGIDTWITKGYTSLWSGIGLPPGAVPVQSFMEQDTLCELDASNYGDSYRDIQVRQI